MVKSQIVLTSLKYLSTRIEWALTDRRNVNGIRNPFSYAPWNIKRTFPAMFDLLESDIVVMQELKIQRKDLKDDMVLLEGWDCFFSLPRQKKGYSGVGVYTRNATCAPVRAEEGVLGALPSPSGVPYRDCPENESIGGYPSSLQIAGLGVDGAALDAEGRCVVLEFPAFVLLGVYAPANSNGMRDDFRHAFHIALDFRIRNLDRLGKRVVLVGDLNVSRDERDTAAAVENCRKAGITHEDYISTPNRRIFNQLLLGGEVVGDRDEKRQQPVLWDTTRGFHPERLGMFTHWEQKTNARPGNHGSRIDFILVSACMRNWVVGANIQEGLLGSDHCPVFIDLADKVQIDGHEVYTKDILNPCGLFDHGVRRRDWQTLGTPAFSARKLPEFTRRQNIKSMFSSAGLKKKSSLSEPEQQTARPNHHVPASEPFSQGGNSAPDNLKTDASISATTPALKKRKISAVAHSPNKRHQSRTISSLLKAQSSLKGFFQPKDAGPLDPGKEGLSTKTDPCGDGAMKVLPPSLCCTLQETQRSKISWSLNPQQLRLVSKPLRMYLLRLVLRPCRKLFPHLKSQLNLTLRNNLSDHGLCFSRPLNLRCVKSIRSRACQCRRRRRA